jgi:hypothetical protein
VVRDANRVRGPTGAITPHPVPRDARDHPLPRGERATRVSSRTRPPGFACGEPEDRLRARAVRRRFGIGRGTPDLILSLSKNEVWHPPSARALAARVPCFLGRWIGLPRARLSLSLRVPVQPTARQGLVVAQFLLLEGLRLPRAARVLTACEAEGRGRRSSPRLRRLANAPPWERKKRNICLWRVECQAACAGRNSAR